jgi:hypothetical protein
MDDIVLRLDISKGSASQGLRQLEELGAILGRRRTENAATRLVARIELKPHCGLSPQAADAARLASSARRLQELEKLLPELPVACARCRCA